MMQAATATTYGQAMAFVASLPVEEQEAFIETVRRSLIEERRAEIAKEAAALKQAVAEGRVKPRTFEELKEELLAELAS